MERLAEKRTSSQPELTKISLPRLDWWIAFPKPEMPCPRSSPRSLTTRWIIFGMGLLLPGLFLTKAHAQAPATWDEFRSKIRPFFAEYCYDCHGPDQAENEVRLDIFRNEAALTNGEAVLTKALKNLSRRKMPPYGERQPPEAEVARVVTWLTNYAAGHDSGPINPGRVTLRRLNRAEYNNTLRDLLGVELRLADDFPADETSFGFDNNGDVLSLAPLLMEKYLAAASRAVETARAADRLPRLTAGADRRETAEKSLRSFATRAFRRPVTGEEVTRLLSLWRHVDTEGRAFEESLDVVLQAVLVSPPFLFRIELEPQPGEAGGIHTLNEFELATRLSYFLWSSMPDAELFALAEQDRLRAELSTQLRRMVADPKAAALVQNFAGQWLELRALRGAAPDPALFPAFDEPLRRAMLQETELFFQAIVREDRSVLDFIDADFTYMNARLAKHYGVAGVEGENFRRVSLVGTPRRGVLTHASILTLTSQPNRTSPVMRGKWVLENLLDAAPPPPPPNIPPLEGRRNEVTGTVRQKMEQHRRNPNCAACHAKMDGIGFALENFDATGAWRTEADGAKIDPSSPMPGGKTINGPLGLQESIKSQSDAFLDGIATKMLTFALGRGIESYDRRSIDRITAAIETDGNRFSALIEAVVRSEPFQKRNGRITQEKR